MKKQLLTQFDRIMLAITFAQSGERQSALNFLSPERDGNRDRKAVQDSERLRKNERVQMRL